MTVIPLTGAPRYYDWGSRTMIQNLMGGKNSGQSWQPPAELWFGAHPDSPSDAFGLPLDQRIAADPVGMIGRQAVKAFGPTLPYLVKILAADRPLSIQVHPTREQAEAGHLWEEMAEVPLDSPKRTFRDRNHKPELIVALSRFEALCGFRPVEATIELLEGLPGLAPLRDILREDGLRAAMAVVLDPDLTSDAVIALTRSVLDCEDRALRGAQHAIACFPGDPGGLVALLLNYVVLHPGEGLYLGAGQVHAYLRGMGVEIMASSDNVLRAGLTTKHVDTERLLAHADFTAREVHPLRTDWFVPPVPDFRLNRVQVEQVDRRLLLGPCLVLCTSGKAHLDDCALDPGEAAFIPASSDVVALTGDGEVFIAKDNL